MFHMVFISVKTHHSQRNEIIKQNAFYHKGKNLYFEEQDHKKFDGIRNIKLLYPLRL